MKSIRNTVSNIFWGVIVGVLVIGAAEWVHREIHGADAPRVRTQTQIQERRVEQIDTITQKIIIEE